MQKTPKENNPILESKTMIYRVSDGFVSDVMDMSVY
jgi:hypothetical protein